MGFKNLSSLILEKLGLGKSILSWRCNTSWKSKSKSILCHNFVSYFLCFFVLFLYQDLYCGSERVPRISPDVYLLLFEISFFESILVRISDFAMAHHENWSDWIICVSAWYTNLTSICYGGSGNNSIRFWGYSNQIFVLQFVFTDLKKIIITGISWDISWLNLSVTLLLTLLNVTWVWLLKRTPYAQSGTCG